ncbi:MAG: polyprenyl synthetase family protein [Pseudomonadota bacterium]
MDRIEAALQTSLQRATAGDAPPRLAAAMRHAVLGQGGRIRPRLCLEVAAACGDTEPELSLAAATAIELIHNASLVHDDLPCFDDAAIRRGKPSVHAAYGEDLAVLVGDQLIVQAFAALGAVESADPRRVLALIRVLAEATGAPHGIIAGQAWESEPSVDVEQYHRAKTAALFEAAAAAGALASGADPTPWREVGRRIGEAYQIADDLADAASPASTLGKPTGQDLRNGVPSVVLQIGVRGALKLLDQRLQQAVTAVPPCERRDDILALLGKVGLRLCPPSLRHAIEDDNDDRPELHLVAAG